MRYTLVYENDIGKITFSRGSGIWLKSADSLTEQNVSLKTTSGNRAIGEELSLEQVKAKTITLRGTILGASDAVRAQMVHVIAPLARGRLVYNDTFSLPVVVKASPDIERYESNAAFSMQFLAPHPYWQKRANVGQTLMGLSPMFHFPWNISSPAPFKFSEYVEIGYVTVHNEGEAPAPWTVLLHALDEVVNPRVYNMATGRYVKLLRTMQDGESIRLSTEGDELTVSIIGADGVETDGFPFLDIESEPFPLAVGENFIKTDADTGLLALRASISYHPLYVGV